jgi:branched-chain amino acid aminotransferase
MQFAFYNGRELTPMQMDVPFYGNRGLFYGDGLFETIKVVDGKPLFLKDHINRLIHGCKLLGLKIPDGCNEVAIKNMISNTTVTNSRVRLTVWRHSSGFYLPDSNETSWLLTFSMEDQGAGPYHSSHVVLALYHENRKPLGWLSNIKSLNGLIYVASAQFALSKNANEALILNSDGNIAEATSSNIFVRSADRWVTPPLSEGCLDGVMRKNLIRIMQKSGIPVIEKELSQDDVLKADEIILTNVIKGIRQVSEIDQKKYTGQSAVTFTTLINAEAGY